MKTYKVVFDGHIEPYDLAKMISNEYGRSAALIDAADNKHGRTEAKIEFDDNVPYEVIELMTDGSVVVEQLVLENTAQKENSLNESNSRAMVTQLTNFTIENGEGTFLSVMVYAYMMANNLSFKEALDQIMRSMENFNEDALSLYLGV